MRRRHGRLAAAPGLSGRVQGDPGRRPEPRRHRAGGARCGGCARRGATASRSFPGARCRPGGPESCGRKARAWRRSRRRRSRRITSSSPTPISSMCRMSCASLSRGRARGGTVLTSLMAKLRCESFAERMFVPAFIFFFQMLYPFAWANNPRSSIAAAAGGCMLVRREALAGGRRHGRDPQRSDRRLRARQAAQGARPDLDRPDRWRAQRPRLSGGRGHPQNGVPHRLCAVAIFAADPCSEPLPVWPSLICFRSC